MPYDLVCVGEVLLDVEAPGLRAGTTVHEPVRVAAGGTPANAALAAAARGARTAVVGRIGADPAGAAIEAALAAAGVADLLVRDAERPTGVFVLGGERAIVADRGASAALSAADVPSALDTAAVLVSGYALLHDDVADAARAALSRAGAARWRAVTAGSAALLERLGPHEAHERCAGANAIFANEAEARALCGLDGEEAARVLVERYELAVVTAGAAGAVAATRDGGAVRARPPEALAGELSGAGDALAGALLAALVAGEELPLALAAACAAATARRTPGGAVGETT